MRKLAILLVVLMLGVGIWGYLASHGYFGVRHPAGSVAELAR